MYSVNAGEEFEYLFLINQIVNMKSFNIFICGWMCPINFLSHNELVIVYGIVP